MDACAIDQNLLAAMANYDWLYGANDHAASRMLAERIADAGRRQKILRYSELANGVIFHPPNINAGAAYEIHVYDWSGLDRHIIGNHLGYLSWKSYERAGFMTSAIVVGGDSLQPSDIFFSWMKDLGVLKSMSEDDILRFWVDQTKACFRWYRDSKGRSVV